MKNPSRTNILYHLITCFIIVLTNLCLAQVFAQDLLTEDITVRHHERKVLLKLTDIGLYKKRFSFPVTYCPFKAKPKDCQKKGSWNYLIDHNLENDIAANLTGQLGGQRYDSLSMKLDKIIASTIFDSIEINSNIDKFSFDLGTGKKFNEAAEKYLNKNIAPLMIRLLGKAKDARYQEMADKEKETFLETIGKEESVPAIFIEKLMASAFVFTLHMHNFNGSVRIDQEERTNAKGKKFRVYDTSVKINMGVNLIIYNFDPDTSKFKLYSTINGYSGQVVTSTDFKKFPKALQSVKDFKLATKDASKASAIAANINLKKDDNFAIFATIDSLKGNRISSRIGGMEDLRVDAPYDIYRHIDGKPSLIGWAKARKVASISNYIDDSVNYSSDFDLISGQAEFKDRIREHPWSGMFWHLGITNISMNLTEFDGEDASGGGSHTGINFGYKFDLGYVFNSISYSEKWFEFNANLAIGGDDLITQTEGRFKNSWVGVVSLDFVQRKYLGFRGIYWGYQYGIAFAGFSANQKVGAIERDLSFTSVSPHLGLQFGYDPSANKTYYLNVDLLSPLYVKGKIKVDDKETRKGIDASFSTVVINLTVGASFHMSSIGQFVGLIR